MDAASPKPSLDGGDRLQAAFASPRIAGLDFIRAIAVSLVLFAHGMESHPSLANAVGPLSALGVEIFFVLSGFLITRLLLDEIALVGRVHLLGFYRRRIARLMPAFYLFLFVGLTTLWLRHKPVPWPAVVSSVLYVTNYYQAFTGAETNLVSHCWSLAVEEQFYTLWPLSAAALMARKWSVTRALLVVIVAVWCWRIVLVLGAHASVDYLYRALDTRADELAVGCLISVLTRSSAWRARLASVTRPKGVAALLALAVIALTLLSGGSAVFKYCVGYILEPLLIGLLIVWTVIVASGPGRLAKVFESELCAHVGRVSYGMYLFHGLIMYSTQRLVERLTGAFWLGLAAAFLAVVAAASASFRWFETPMRKLIVGRRR